jgi:hypothetical protein
MQFNIVILVQTKYWYTLTFPCIFSLNPSHIGTVPK